MNSGSRRDSVSIYIGVVQEAAVGAIGVMHNDGADRVSSCTFWAEIGTAVTFCVVGLSLAAGVRRHNWVHPSVPQYNGIRYFHSVRVMCTVMAGVIGSTTLAVTHQLRPGRLRPQSASLAAEMQEREETTIIVTITRRFCAVV